MKSFDYPILAKEGRAHLVIALATGLISTWLLGWWSLIVWAAVVFVFQFFRDPPRSISIEQGAVVAPASGKVVFIGEQENPYIKGIMSLKISIFMNVFSVHSNLVPVAGNIEETWYTAGSFVNAALDKASTHNERNAIWIKTPTGDDVVSVQIAGLVARRILSYVKKGDSVETGQRYGFIRFGSRVDLYLPVDTTPGVQLGQNVTSGNDVVACLGQSSGLH